MFMCRAALTAAIATCLGLPIPALAQNAGQYGFGRTPSAAEIAGWDIDVRPDGMGLPQGQGTAKQGREIFNQRCAACHGEDLKGQLGGALVGGQGSLGTDKPLRTVGSYWPYATTLFDYIRRAMPFDAPQTLTNDEVYATAAYILFQNQIVGEDDAMNASSLAQVQMPNRDGFIPDSRPDIHTTACYHDCKKGEPQTRPPRPSESGAGAPAPTDRPGQTGVGGGTSPQ